MPIPLDIGDGKATPAWVTSFDGLVDSGEHVLVELGEPTEFPLVRVHSECLTGDVLGSLRCDCGPQLTESLRRVNERGGAVVYLRQEGRGIGLYNKLDAYGLQDAGADTFTANLSLGFAADSRDYAVAAQVLRASGLTRIELLSNNPVKARQLRAYGIDVVRVVPTGVHANPHNLRYLTSKVVTAQHDIDMSGYIDVKGTAS